MPNDILPEWERVLSAAAHLQRILPGAVLVGGSAAAVYAGHRLSTDADHVLTDLRERFDQVLADLEAVAGWKTARIRRPVQILSSLDGIETGVRQLIREQPLETTQIEYQGQTITLRVSGPDDHPSHRSRDAAHQSGVDSATERNPRLSRFCRSGRSHGR
jgi:hypothetical protein